MYFLPHSNIQATLILLQTCGTVPFGPLKSSTIYLNYSSNLRGKNLDQAKIITAIHLVPVLLKMSHQAKNAFFKVTVFNFE